MEELLDIKNIYYPIINDFNLLINLKINCIEINDNILNNFF